MSDRDERIIKRLEDLAIIIQTGFDMLSSQIDQYISELRVEMQHGCARVDQRVETRVEKIDTPPVLRP